MSAESIETDYVREAELLAEHFKARGLLPIEFSVLMAHCLAEMSVQLSGADHADEYAENFCRQIMESVEVLKTR